MRQQVRRAGDNHAQQDGSGWDIGQDLVYGEVRDGARQDCARGFLEAGCSGEARNDKGRYVRTAKHQEDHRNAHALVL